MRLPKHMPFQVSHRIISRTKSHFKFDPNIISSSIQISFQVRIKRDYQSRPPFLKQQCRASIRYSLTYLYPCHELAATNRHQSRRVHSHSNLHRDDHAIAAVQCEINLFKHIYSNALCQMPRTTNPFHTHLVNQSGSDYRNKRHGIKTAQITRHVLLQMTNFYV